MIVFLVGSLGFVGCFLNYQTADATLKLSLTEAADIAEATEEPTADEAGEEVAGAEPEEKADEAAEEITEEVKTEE